MQSESSVKSDDKLEGLLANWVYFVVAVCSVALLLVSHVLSAEHPEMALFVKELGFAGIIALILIFTIEKFSRQRHQRAADKLVQRMNENLFHAIYSRYIPSHVFAEVEKTLLKANVFRRDHEVTYTLTNFNNGHTTAECERHVKCRAQSSYTLENITSGPVKHQIALSLEIPVDTDWKDHLKILSVKIDGQALSPQDIARHTTDTDAQRQFSYAVSIPSNGKVTVQTDAELVKRKLDQEIWTSKLPSDGIKLLVSVPGQDLEVFAQANHAEPLEKVLDNETTKRWCLKFGMLPYQSIVFWWRSKEPQKCPLVTPQERR